MSRDHDELSKRPDRVIIVDADNPMTEVHGEFVWREEHDRVVDEVRRQALTEGYEAGARDGAATLQVQVRRKHPLGIYLRVAVGILLVLLVLLMLPVVLT
jgi:hypothetical protein